MRLFCLCLLLGIAGCAETARPMPAVYEGIPRKIMDGFLRDGIYVMEYKGNEYLIIRDSPGVAICSCDLPRYEPPLERNGR